MFRTSAFDDVYELLEITLQCKAFYPVLDGGGKKSVAINFGCVTNFLELKIVFSLGLSGMLCKIFKRDFK